MKNICFLVGSLNNSGGTERVATLVANGLVKSSNHSVLILSLSDSDNPFFDLNPIIDVHSIHTGNVSFKKKFIQTVLRIRKFVMLHNINTLIVVDSLSCIFSIPALFGLRTNHICWEHFNFKNNNDRKLRDVGRRIAAKYCDFIVTLTKRDKELWEQGIKTINANIVSIPNPSPYEDIQHTPNLDFKTILSVGHLRHVKGFDLLIEAWAKVCAFNADWTLCIVGSGEEEEKLKQQVSGLGISSRVSFISVVKDVEPYYRTSSFYCLSSRFEGLPMVLLEAQAFGLPIVSFDCEVGPSEIVDDGINGWLVPPQNIESLKKALLNAIYISKEDYEKFSKNSVDNSKLFAVDNIINKWIDIV